MHSPNQCVKDTTPVGWKPRKTTYHILQKPQRVDRRIIKVHVVKLHTLIAVNPREWGKD